MAETLKKEDLIKLFNTITNKLSSLTPNTLSHDLQNALKKIHSEVQSLERAELTDSVKDILQKTASRVGTNDRDVLIAHLKQVIQNLLDYFERMDPNNIKKQMDELLDREDISIQDKLQTLIGLLISKLDDPEIKRKEEERIQAQKKAEAEAAAKDSLSNAIAHKTKGVFDRWKKAMDDIAKMSPHYPMIHKMNETYKTNEAFFDVHEKIDMFNRLKKVHEKIAQKIVIALSKIAVSSDPKNEEQLMTSAMLSINDTKQKGDIEPKSPQAGGADFATDTTATNATDKPAEPPKVDLKKHLDLAKKHFRAAMNISYEIQKAYDKSLTYTLPRIYSRIEDKDKSEDDIFDAFKKRVQEIAGENNEKITSEQDKIRGNYDALKDEQKWVDKLPDDIKNITDELNNAKKAIDTMVESDKNNETLVQTGKLMLRIYDGDSMLSNESTTEITPTKSTVGLADHLQKILTGIRSEYESVVKVIQPAASGISKKEERSSKANEAMINANRGYAQRVPGFGGGGDEPANTKTTKNRLQYVNDTLDYIFKKSLPNGGIIKDLDLMVRTSVDPVYGSLSPQPSLFDDIYRTFLKTKSSEGNVVAALNLEQTLRANNLIPAEVLNITLADRFIFIFAILLIRLFTLVFTEYFIDKEWFGNLNTCLMAFAVIYSILFTIFVLVINFDLYRLRIVFNYVNMHINTSIILTHLFEIWILVGIVLIVVNNVNTNMIGFNNAAMSDESKAHLKYRLELSTMVIWIFIIMFVFII